MYWRFRLVSNHRWGGSVQVPTCYLALFFWCNQPFHLVRWHFAPLWHFRMLLSPWTDPVTQRGGPWTLSVAIKADSALQMTRVVPAAFSCVAELEALDGGLKLERRGTRAMISMGDCGRFWVSCWFFGLCITNKKITFSYQLPRQETPNSVGGVKG